MKIAFVTSEYPPKNIGGAGISSELIVEGLRERGANVDVYSITGESYQIVQTKENHYEIPALEELPLPIAVRENMSVLRELPNLSSYDIVHSYNTSHLPATVARSDVPLIATINNHMWVCIDPVRFLKEDWPESSLARKIRYSRSAGFSGLRTVGRVGLEIAGKYFSKQADHITVQTEGMKRVLKNSGYKNQQISIIPNLVDPQFLRDEPTTHNGQKKLIFVGRLVDQKGAIDALRAFLSLPSTIRSDWDFEIYGDGPQRVEVEDIIDRHEKENISIEYMPYRRLSSVYESADAMIHPSKYTEPFSRTWMEGMATWTPIICSDNPSTRSVLQDVAAFYDPFDRNDLTNTLQRVLTSPAERETLAKAGRDHVETFHPDNVIPKYLSLYKGMIEN